MGDRVELDAVVWWLARNDLKSLHVSHFVELPPTPTHPTKRKRKRKRAAASTFLGRSRSEIFWSSQSPAEGNVGNLSVAFYAP